MCLPVPLQPLLSQCDACEHGAWKGAVTLIS